MNPRVDLVHYESPYKLIITFSSKEVKEFDLTPFLKYPVYEKLQDESFCKTVFVRFGTVMWDDEIDFDPDRLYLEGKKPVSL
jgi:hypothetical protein